MDGLTAIVPSRRGTAMALARAARPHQWLKNVLLLVPAIAGHRLDATTLGACARAFVAFSLCASSAYVLNDAIDVDGDRRHAVKCRRPIAAGEVSVRTGYALSLALLGASALAAWTLPAGYRGALLAYVAVTAAYSARAKRIPVLDVIVLAGLYVLRVVAGSLATGIPASDWLLSFAMFLFLSLALVKRTSELRREDGERTASVRGYVRDDEAILAPLGVASGCVAVLVLALYLQSPAVTKLYATPRILWLLCPVLLYWLSRAWFLARRGLVNEDPIVFALTDRVSYLVAGAAGVVLYAAS